MNFKYDLTVNAATLLVGGNGSSGSGSSVENDDNAVERLAQTAFLHSLERALGKALVREAFLGCGGVWRGGEYRSLLIIVDDSLY